MAAPNRMVVTGASGFIGRHVVRHALEAGWSVRALTRRAALLDGLRHPALDVVDWDVRGARSRPEVLQGADALCHLAAFVPPDHRDPAYARPCFEVNTVGTVDLFEAAAGVAVPAVVYCSAGNAYRTDRPAAREDDALGTSSVSPFYLASKVAADVLAEYYREARGLRVLTVRLPVVYGPGMSEASFLVRCIRRLRCGTPIEVFHGGRYRADWLYVEDFARALLVALERGTAGPMNLGSGTTHELREVAAAAADVVEADASLVRLRPAEDAAAVPRLPGLDVSRARAELDFEPTPLRTGIARVAASVGDA